MSNHRLAEAKRERMLSRKCEHKDATAVVRVNGVEAAFPVKVLIGEPTIAKRGRRRAYPNHPLRVEATAGSQKGG